MRRVLIIASAWIAMLFASFLPFVIWRLVLHENGLSPWIAIVQLVALGTALALTLVSSTFRPLRGLVSALLAFVIGDWIRYALENTPAIMAWTRTAPQYEWIFLDSVIALIPGLLMALTLIGSGLKRQDVFLAKGDLSAPSTMPLGIRRASWKWLGPILIVIFSIPLALPLASVIHGQPSATRKLFPTLPIILAFAIINAGSEEFRFRSVLLARSEHVLGAGQAVLLTSTLFGLGHWFGHPSGPLGVLMAGLAGWFWGKSMIETRGFLWAWLIHGIQDVFILAFVVITTT